MLLNASEINSAEVNGLSSLLLSVDVTEGFTLSTALIYFQIDKIFETISYSDSTSTTTTFGESLVDYFTLIDVLLVQLNGNIDETITYSSALTGIIKQIEHIKSKIILSSSINNQIIFVNSVLSLINLIDANAFGINKDVVESMVMESSVDVLYKLVNSVIENIAISSSSSYIFVGKEELSSAFKYTSSLLSVQDIKEILSENFIITVPTASGQDVYLAYAFSPETNSTSTYTNYNFSSSTKFKSKYLFANSSGLYEYGGDTDDGSLIKMTLETSAISFGSSSLNQVPAIYLGVSNDDVVYLKVRVDGRGECHYKLNKKSEGLDTRKIDLGKGLIGRYFQFELITTSPVFNLESIEFFPIELRRKI